MERIYCHLMEISDFLRNQIVIIGPYLLMSDDVRWNRTSDTYYTNSLVKFDANSSVVPLTMYLASKRYGPMLKFGQSLYITCFSISSIGWGSWCCFCSRCKHCSRIKSWRMLVRLEGVTSLKLGGGLEQYNGGLLWPIGSKKKTCSLVPHSAPKK